jgi:hypothetical protein
MNTTRQFRTAKGYIERQAAKPAAPAPQKPVPDPPTVEELAERIRTYQDTGRSERKK